MNSKRNIFLVVFIISFAASSVFIAAQNVQASPATIYVPDDYPTIQQAISAASPGETIIVRPGTYPETLTISKSLTIRGDPGDASPGPGVNAPILDGSTLGNHKTAVKISEGVSNVIFEGFEIRNYGTDTSTDNCGVSAWNTGTFNIQIRDNYIHDVGYDAILTGNGWGGPQGLHSGWIITRNIIKNFGAYAIDLENAKDSQITNNIISDPKSTTTYGIVILALGCGTNTIDMSNIVVSNNQIINYPDRAINVMAWTTDASAAATLRGVTISGNSITGSFNVIIAWKMGSGSNTLKDITISDNTITVNNPKSANYILDLSDVSGTNILQKNVITLNGVIGGGGTFFHAVNIGGSATGSWSILNNKLDGNNVGANSAGFRIRSNLPTTAILNLQCNDITEFAFGVLSDALASGVQFKVECCNIYRNSQYGISNGAGAIINAENNFWGSGSGPTHPSNPGGTGDKVSDNVDFDPWLKSWACVPVGGVWVPINKFELLAPCIGYVSVIAVAAASLVLVKRRKKQQN